MKAEETLWIVSEDFVMAESISRLAHSHDLDTEIHRSTEDFLKKGTFLKEVNPPTGGCLIVDRQQPGMNNHAFQKTLAAKNKPLPLIILIDSADTRFTVEALRQGALSVLDKPWCDHELWSTIQEGLEYYRATLQIRRHQNLLRSRFQSLSSSERKVLKYVVQGYANKVIANKLDVSVRTVESRRRRICDVTQARSVAKLVRFAFESGIETFHLPSKTPPWHISPTN